ncbi:hypothetical protein DVH24_003040 [Malus domestica]|uniref:Uncharacterized protein n=1 Tax=Malus domestica TaxID=3750 RepID=A0A498KBW8_MALDO|nr:hypothetical protein DVH24_003040 [Malus domestica]
MSLSTRLRRPQPSDDPSSSSSPPPPQSSSSYSKVDKQGKSDGGVDKGLGWFFPLVALGMLRYMSATSNIIHDCDEVFNYWEPLHFLLYKSGFQTWEYSSQFALRSYLYILFHALVGQPASWLFAEEKVRVFYAVRIFLGLLSVITDTVLVVALSRKYGKRLASYTLAMLCLTSGCFFASTSFLPSSFSMYAMSLSSGLFLLDKYTMAVTVAAVGVILGWPFSILAFLPVTFYSLARRFKQAFLAGAAISVALLVFSVLVDHYYYSRWTSSVLNLLIYNVAGGGESHLFLYPIYPLICVAASAVIESFPDVFRSDYDSQGNSPTVMTAKILRPVVLSFILCASHARTFSVINGYSAPIEVYKLLEHHDDVGTGSVLCVGSEWHRFPSSFFVPDYVGEVRWIDDGFRGLLPFPFNTLGGTAAAPPYLNNKNKASDLQYLRDLDQCTFLVELQLSRPFPSRGSDLSTWEVIGALPYLDRELSPAKYRSFFIPYLWQHKNIFGMYKLLRRKLLSCVRLRILDENMRNFEPLLSFVFALEIEILDSFCAFDWTGLGSFACHCHSCCFSNACSKYCQRLHPDKLRNYFYSGLYNISRRFSSQLTNVIDEFQGLFPNEIFEAGHAYLGAIATPRLSEESKRAAKEKKLAVSVDRGEELADVYENVQVKWKLIYVEVKSPFARHRGDLNASLRQEARFYELTFHKKLKEKVLNSYLPYILERSKEIKREHKAVKFHTVEQQRWFPDAVKLDHPMTFKLLAMDTELKKAVLDDLNNFIYGKEFYRRVGKAWKRGYLLYGPPGTGKSSLIAAMVNHLNYDIYELDLTSVNSNSDLSKLLFSMPNQSIIVFEDIDCTIKLQNGGTGG